jgi:hypothetical protein
MERAGYGVRMRAHWACLAGTLATALACSALPACSDDTGILIEVGLAVGTTRPERLAFAIASTKTVGGRPIAVQDPASSITVDVTGRDLAASPYRLFVHDGLGAGGSMLGAVVGSAGARTVGFAAVPATRFVAGKTLLVHVDLAGPGDAVVGPTGCVTFGAGNTTQTLASASDQDCDGYRSIAAGGDDCDDTNPNVHPGAREVCANGIDDNCNGMIDESPDADHDGYGACSGDCDDNDPTVHPGAREVCDGKDNDCNGVCDDGFDKDGDGYTTCGTQILANGTCRTGVAPDCNDGDASIHPGAVEVCDGKDNDCNGLCDDGGVDHDGDGFTPCGTLASFPAPAGGVCGATSPLLVDCRDTGGPSAALIHPFAPEICDGVDQNCDGKFETSEPCLARGGGMGGGCAVGSRACNEDRSAGPVGLAATCTTTGASPGVEEALCDAYLGACAADAQPWRCATEAAAAATLDCTVAFTRAAGTAQKPPSATVCAGSLGAAPTLGNDQGCVFSIVGGVGQEGYRAGLRATGSSGAPQPSFAGCQADLAVGDATNDFAPQPDEWVLLVADSNRDPSARAVVVHVTPALVAACPSAPVGCKMRTP